MTTPPLQTSYDSDEMDAINANGQLACAVCDRVFKNASGLAIHRAKAHGAAPKAPKAPKAPTEDAERVAVARPVLRVECPCCRASFTVKVESDTA